MVIDLGETQVFERQMAQALGGMINADLVAADLAKQLDQVCGIHRL